MKKYIITTDELSKILTETFISGQKTKKKEGIAYEYDGYTAAEYHKLKSYKPLPQPLSNGVKKHIKKEIYSAIRFPDSTLLDPQSITSFDDRVREIIKEELKHKLWH